MSQNGPYPGPPWPGGNSDGEPYAEPSDPWQEHAVAEPSWHSNSPTIPQQPQSAPFHSVPPSDNWGSPAAPTRRNTPIVALVVVLGLLIVAGLGTTAWLLNKRDHKQPVAGPTTAPATPSSTVTGSQDARFVTVNQCVENKGTAADPDMHKSPCTSGTFKVLKVVKGSTTGEADAEKKCAGVVGYTNWFFYDSDFDELDVVLCLKKL
jgi:hypothetical protein